MVSQVGQTWAPTARDIRRFCGTSESVKGRDYFLHRRVLEMGPHPSQKDWLRATVRGTKPYTVDLWAPDLERMEAYCTCPAYARMDTCKHVAAVLWSLSSEGPIAREIEAPTPNPRPKVGGIPRPQEPVKVQATRELSHLLAVFEPVVKPAPSFSGDARPLLAQFGLIFNLYPQNASVRIEMKIGPKRPYVVQKIDDFLARMQNATPFTFSSRFTWNPSEHYFRPEDGVVIDILQRIRRIQAAYNQSRYGGGISYGAGDRSLFVPPDEWPTLQEALRQTDCYLAFGPHSGTSLSWSDGKLPMQTRVDRTVQGGFDVHLRGLDQVAPIMGYGAAISRATIYPLSPSSLHRLQQLKNLHRDQAEVTFTLQASEFEVFLNRVVPGLRELGTVEMAPRVTDLVVDQPLTPRLYLDRQDDQLSARLEFSYGDFVFNPLVDIARSQRGLVARDVMAENELIAALTAAQFRPGERAFLLDDEEAIYQFLFRALEELEQRVEVYATEAVDPLIRRRHARPKTRVDLDASQNWLEVSFEVEDLDAHEIQALLRSILAKRRFHRLRDGSFISLETETYRGVGQLLQDLDASPGDLAGGGLKVAAVRALALSERDSDEVSLRWGKSLRRWLDNLRHPENLEYLPPKTLAPVLRDYQKAGFEWMKMLAEYGFGGILADEMGLGKTLQSIAFLASEREGGAFQAPALIVCPASLVYNWQAEIEKFAPHLKSAVIAGTREERLLVLQQEETPYDIWITSYPLLRRDLAHYHHRFHALILDEAQVIKNHATQTAKAVSGLQSSRRFALSGTPVENSLDDLWSIFHAVFPGLFQHKQSFAGMNPDQVASRVRPFILRRLKSDVLKELPPKIETLESSELTPEQKRLYMAYLATLQDETLGDLRGEGFQKSRFKILAGLTRLRQLCCHPALFVQDYHGGSGKLEQLLELIEECLSGDKRVLVFSQFTSMLAIIKDQLVERKWPFFYLDGNTKAQERLDLCTQFNQGRRPIFLISLKAGGTGLNLTGADTVILYDLWWNPAVESQAADRAHRIGQQKVVQVIRMISRGTIEEKIYLLQQKKRDLIERVVTANSEGLDALSEADVRELLSL